MYPTLKAFLRAGVLAGSWDSNAHAEFPGGRPWRTPRVGISAIFYYRGLLKKAKKTLIWAPQVAMKGVSGGAAIENYLRGIRRDLPDLPLMAGRYV